MYGRHFAALAKMKGRWLGTNAGLTMCCLEGSVLERYKLQAQVSAVQVGQYCMRRRTPRKQARGAVICMFPQKPAIPKSFIKLYQLDALALAQS